MVRELHEMQGKSISEIAREQGMSRSTMRKYLKQGHVPDKRVGSKRGSKLDPYKDELEQNSTCAKFAQVQNEGNRFAERTFDYYNLDMIISVGYRVKSQRGIAFRKWATSILKEYIVQGYAVNDRRIKILHRIRLSNYIWRRYISIHSRKSGTPSVFHSQRPSFY